MRVPGAGLSEIGYLDPGEIKRAIAFRIGRGAPDSLFVRGHDQIVVLDVAHTVEDGYAVLHQLTVSDQFRLDVIERLGRGVWRQGCGHHRYLVDALELVDSVRVLGIGSPLWQRVPPLLKNPYGMAQVFVGRLDGAKLLGELAPTVDEVRAQLSACL